MIPAGNGWAICAALALFLLWSSSFSIVKTLLATSPPLFLLALRLGLASLLLLPCLAATPAAQRRATCQQWPAILRFAICTIYLTNACEFWALQYLSSAQTALLYNSSPLFAILFSYIYFQETVTWSKCLGMLICSAGLLPIYDTGALGVISWPQLAVLTAAACSTYGWIVMRQLGKREAISIPLANASAMLIAGLFALFHSWCCESWQQLPQAASQIGPFLAWTVLITLISNVICFNAYALLLQRFTATFLSFLATLSPIFASLHGWLLLDEQPAKEIFIATAITSYGLWLIYHSERQQGYIQPATRSAPENC